METMNLLFLCQSEVPITCQISFIANYDLVHQKKLPILKVGGKSSCCNWKMVKSVNQFLNCLSKGLLAKDFFKGNCDKIFTLSKNLVPKPAHKRWFHFTQLFRSEKIRNQMTCLLHQNKLIINVFFILPHKWEKIEERCCKEAMLNTYVGAIPWLTLK